MLSYFSRSKKASGFTLIELVTVIVILAILAFIAAKKFIDFKRESRIATLNKIASAMKSAADMAHSKAVMAGVESDFYKDGVINGKAIKFNYRYPFPNTNGIAILLDIDITGWTMGVNNSQHTLVSNGTMSGMNKYNYNVTFGEIAGDSIEPQNTGCFVQYSSESLENPIEIKVVTTNC